MTIVMQMAFDWWEPTFAYPDGVDAPAVEHASYIKTVKTVMRIFNYVFLGGTHHTPNRADGRAHMPVHM